MAFLVACRAVAPAFACQHGDLLLYLVPSAALALLIRLLAGTHPAFFIFTVAGTICHELAHFGVGWLVGARPTGLTVIPRRSGRSWELGSVTLTRVRWYNAAPAALAPFLIVALPLVVARWRTVPGWTFHPVDLLIAFGLAPQMLSFWPSAVDWCVALRSWPYLLVIALLLALAWPIHPSLFQFVKP
ncbi:MAG: hypothetical protein QFF03_18475 [Pseudomonadota bacterium]|nr:hypothetical protein [Pseudomonadota bacterium]